MRIARLAFLCAGLLAVCADAQYATGQSMTPQPEKAATDWSFSASAYAYIVPESKDYVQPTITADRRWLHLEARYNYEDLETASVWVGYNFSVGENVSLDITPMLGGVFGDTAGIAPGLRGSLKWWLLELYGEVWHASTAGTGKGSPISCSPRWKSSRGWAPTF